MSFADALILVSYFGGIAAAWLIPSLIKNLQVARQNRLIEDCRGRYILAVEHLASNDEAAARALLVEIRALEARWLVGLSLRNRAALGCFSIGLGILVGTVLRLLMFARPGASADLSIVVATVAVTAMHTVGSFYYEPWTSPWLIDDFGDRLEDVLDAGRSIPAWCKPTNRQRVKDGLAAREALGLDPGFTLKDLNAARRRMAARYYPDRWLSAPAGAAKAAEDAMKRINAAYDELKAAAA